MQQANQIQEDLPSPPNASKISQSQGINGQFQLDPNSLALTNPPPKSSLWSESQENTFGDLGSVHSQKSSKTPVSQITRPRSSLELETQNTDGKIFNDADLLKLLQNDKNSKSSEPKPLEPKPQEPKPFEPSEPLTSPRFSRKDADKLTDPINPLDRRSPNLDQASISQDEDQASINSQRSIELDSYLNDSPPTYSKIAILEHLFYLSKFDKSAIFLGKKSDLEKTFLKKFNNVFSRCVSCARSGDIAIENSDNQQNQSDEYVFVTEDQYFLVTCRAEEIKEQIKSTQYLPNSSQVEIDLTNIENNSEIKQFKISDYDILTSFNRNLQDQICLASKKISFSPKTKTQPKISCTLGMFGIKKSRSSVSN